MTALERQQKEGVLHQSEGRKQGNVSVSALMLCWGDYRHTVRSGWLPWNTQEPREPQVLDSGGWKTCNNPGSFYYIWKIEVEIYFLFFFSNDIESTWGPTSRFKEYFSFVCAALLTFLGFYNITGFRGSGILQVHTASCCKTRGVFRKGLLWQLRPVEWLQVFKLFATPLAGL